MSDDISTTDRCRPVWSGVDLDVGCDEGSSCWEFHVENNVGCMCDAIDKDGDPRSFGHHKAFPSSKLRSQV